MQKRGKNPATPSVKVHTAPAQKLLVRQEPPDAKAENGRQSPEFGFAEFWSFCTRLLLKQEFPDAKAETGKLSKNSALQNNAKSVAFCSFLPLQRKTQYLRQNLIAKAAKAETGKPSPEFGFAEFLSFCTRLLIK